MPVCLQIIHALKMHKGVNELCLLSNTLTEYSYLDSHLHCNSLRTQRNALR